MASLPQPFLIQRLQRRYGAPVEDANGIDRWFILDYMGAAEFEFGTPYKMHTDMSARADEMQVHKMEYNGTTMWYVGLESQIEEALLVLKNHIDGTRMNLKEATYLMQSLNTEKYLGDTVGWWAYTEHSRPSGDWRLWMELPWAIFKTEQDAAHFLEGLHLSKTHKR